VKAGTLASASPSYAAVALAQRVLPLLAQHADDVDQSGRFPSEGINALRESGLFGLLVPAEYGGLDGDLGDLVAVARILAGECMSTAMVWAMHCQQSDALVRHARRDLQATVLPGVADGRIYLGSVTSEPGKGGHLLSAASALLGDGDLLRIDREGPVVTGGQHADAFLATFRDRADAAPHEVTLVYVPRSRATVTPGPFWDALGMRGTQSGSLHLAADVRLTDIVGERGRFRAVAVDSMIPSGHLGWAACWIGAAHGALRRLVSLLRSPDRPRNADLSSDLAAERLARIRLDIETVAAYLHCVLDEVTEARRASRPLDDPAVQIHLNSLKVVAAEHTFRAIDRMVQFAGLSRGYLRHDSLALERCFRDLRSASLNYADDRLLTAIGKLTIMDRSVRLT
jgi:acyl-CoA dehydrogenase